MPNVLQQLFGTKPDVPTFTPLDLGVEQQKAETANIAATPAAANLANITTDQVTKMLSNTLGTDFSTLQSDIGGQITSEIAGQIPKDVQDQIQTNAAASSIGGGFSGSGAQGNLVARDLGLTSLGLINQGISSAESWISQSESLLSPGISAFTSMFITPQQQASFDSQQQEQQFQVQWMQNQINAQPDPVLSGLFSAFGSAVQAFSPSGMLGGGGGGKGGGGGGGGGGALGSIGGALGSWWSGATSGIGAAGSAIGGAVSSGVDAIGGAGAGAGGAVSAAGTGIASAGSAVGEGISAGIGALAALV